MTPPEVAPEEDEDELDVPSFLRRSGRRSTPASMV
jgi:hypothetical protein